MQGTTNQNYLKLTSFYIVDFHVSIPNKLFVILTEYSIQMLE